MGDKNNNLGSYYAGGLCSSASSTISSNYYSSTDPYDYTIRIDTEDAKKQILEAVKDEMKKDEDVNDLLEIAKAILLDYISKTTEKPEVVFEDLNNRLKKKEKEIELLKAKIEYLESRVATLEASEERNKKCYSDGITYTGGTDNTSSITYTIADSSNIDLSSSSQTI